MSEYWPDCGKGRDAKRRRKQALLSELPQVDPSPLPDIESLTTKIQGVELDPNKSNTLKTQQHKAGSYCYVVVHCDGETKQPVEYRGPNAAEHFLFRLSPKTTTIPGEFF